MARSATPRPVTRKALANSSWTSGPLSRRSRHVLTESICRSSFRATSCARGTCNRRSSGSQPHLSPVPCSWRSLLGRTSPRGQRLGIDLLSGAVVVVGSMLGEWAGLLQPGAPDKSVQSRISSVRSRPGTRCRRLSCLPRHRGRNPSCRLRAPRELEWHLKG